LDKILLLVGINFIYFFEIKDDNNTDW
jgi:hypothetical protein